MKYKISLNKRKLPKSIGNKAANIRRLADIGVRFPRSYVISWDASRSYLPDDASLVMELKIELASIIEYNNMDAVRSSSNIEVSPDRSFAGKYISLPNKIYSL